MEDEGLVLLLGHRVPCLVKVATEKVSAENVRSRRPQSPVVGS